MTRQEANKKMKSKSMRERWIMEALGTFDAPKSTKYLDGLLYVVWHDDHYMYGKDEAEVYDTSNIYGECERAITLAEYEKVPHE